MRPKRMWNLLALAITAILMQTACIGKPTLKCRPDGTFKIVMMSDLHHSPKPDMRTVDLMGKMLDTEQPDVVVLAGDLMWGDASKNMADLKKTIATIAEPMEKRNIPWVFVFGNHDQEHFGTTKIDKGEIIKVYQSYRNNLNKRGPVNIHGAGNDNLFIKDQTGKNPIFCMWLVDSGAYAPKAIGGYEWIHTDQVGWYYQTSLAMEKRYGRKIPGLMFIHIELPEYAQMDKAGKIIGNNYEEEAPSKINGGMFAAILDRGDVKGVFCGHDHKNNHYGNWYGVQLGHDSAVGYDTYNWPETDPRHLRSRGARVFLIDEKDPENYKTWMRFCDGATNKE